MANFPLVTFNSGELSPQIDARSDIDKYRAGCRILENMIPRIYGPATRRPGTKYIDTCNGVSRVISFIYSNTIAYIILLEDLKMWFYYNGGQVLDSSGRRLYIDTPYVAADLFELQFKQSNDVMWIVHPSYAPRKLSRTSANSFSLDEITFTNGPFKKRNDIENDDGITLTPSVTTGSGTLTASDATFEVGHYGALFSITQPRVNVTVSGTLTAAGVLGGTSILTEGPCTLNISSGWAGTVELQRSIDGGTTWEVRRSFFSNDGKRAVQYTFSEDEDNVLHRIYVKTISNYQEQTTVTDDDGDTYNTYVTKTSTVGGDLTVNTSTQTGICRITGYTSSTSVSMTVLKDFASTSADERWSEGCWSIYRGFPKSVTFFEGRVVYAGTPHQPQTIWLSASDDYENFKAGTKDDDSFSLTISSETRNAIQWIAALEALLVGTSGGEWRIRSSAEDEPLTPTNYSIKQQSSYGSKYLQALQVGDAVLFADFVGRRVRELTFSDTQYKYVARDMTALAEHITDSGIVGMAYQKNPDPILWCFRADGTLLSMTYEREQNVIAWSRHPFEVGEGVTSESIITIPGYSFRSTAYMWASSSEIFYWSPNAIYQRMGEMPDNGVHGGALATKHDGTETVAGYYDVPSGTTSLAKFDYNLNEDITYYVPDAGWKSGGGVGWLMYSNDDAYLYASSSQGFIKFDTSTGDEISTTSSLEGTGMAIDSSGNIYRCGSQGVWIYDSNGTLLDTLLGVASLFGPSAGGGRHIAYDRDNDRIYFGGSLLAVNNPDPPGWPNGYYHCFAVNPDDTEPNAFYGEGEAWGNGPTELRGILVKDGYAYYTGDAVGGYGIWKFDSEMNLVALAETTGGSGICETHDGNIMIVQPNVYAEHSKISIFDTDLNLVKTEPWTGVSTYFLNATLVKIPYLTQPQTVESTLTISSEGLGVNSVAVIPGEDEDEVWLVVTRIINEQKVRYLEQMQPRDWGSDAEDQWFVDSGLDYDSDAATTFSGLDHLEGEEVAILADGAVAASQTVTNGSVTLSDSASRVIIGLPFRYKLKPMRIDFTGAANTSQTAIKKIGEVVVSFYKSGNVEYGVDVDNLFKVEWRTTEDYDSPPDLLTGDVLLNPEGGFDAQDSLILTGNTPLNCCIRSIVPRVFVTGR
jgi:hypothetical protein